VIETGGWTAGGAPASGPGSGASEAPGVVAGGADGGSVIVADGDGSAPTGSLASALGSAGVADDGVSGVSWSGVVVGR
jgi:hypothetical protein